MEFKLIKKYLYSNFFVIVVLILIPFILSITFGNYLYNENNLGGKVEYLDKANIPEGSSSYPVEANRSIQKEISNTENINNILKQVEKLRFNSYFSAITSVSKIGMVLGSVLASVFIGKIVSDGSIIYLLVNKRNRNRSFFELITILLPLILLTSFLTATVISSMVFNEFPDRSLTNILFFTFGMISYSLISGYIMAMGITVITRNEIAPILGVTGIVYSLPLLEHGEQLLLSPRSLLINLIYGWEVEWVWSTVGIGMVIGFLVLIYIRIRVGDFYK